MRRVGALILAAGGSTRFGEPKQFLKVRGESLIGRITRAAIEAGCSAIVIVAGDAFERLRSELTGGEVIHNADWQRGIGSSIKCGLAHLRDKVDAIVILAADQPFVSASMIRELISREAAIIASSYANTIGIPAVFATTCFDALQALPDNSGAKPVIEQHRDDTIVVSLPAAEIDIDTRADYDRALRLASDESTLS